MSKAAKSITGAIPGGKALATMVDPMNFSGAGSDGIKNLLLGKKDPGAKDGYAELDPLQRVALGKYGEALNQNTDQLAKNAVAKQENLIRGGAQDAERKASQLIAQRGLGNSSVGMNALINSTKDMGDKLSATRAGLPQLQYDMKMNNLDRAAGGITNILSSRDKVYGRAAGRVGGLAPLIGMGIGGAFGGLGGAQIGGGVGSALTQVG